MKPIFRNQLFYQLYGADALTTRRISTLGLAGVSTTRCNFALSHSGNKHTSAISRSLETDAYIAVLTQCASCIQSRVNYVPDIRMTTNRNIGILSLNLK